MNKELFKNSKIFEIDGDTLTIDDVYKIAHAKPFEYFLKLKKSSLKKMHESNDYVQEIVESEVLTYGINTGFGALSNKFISKNDLKELQYNLIRSHCTGVGEPFSPEITRAIMLLRANCLAQGFSGVTPDAVELILDFLNYHIHPIVPQKGSVGASGDLAPLSHIALALIGEGEVIFHGKRIHSLFAIEQIEKTPAILGPKDGLALINGTAVMAALGCLSLVEAKRLAISADIIAALTLDGVRGTIKAFDPKIAKLKPHLGQLAVTKNMNMILEGSEILNSHFDCKKVQDPYSLRCIPQVHGSCRQTFTHAEEVLSIEINAVTDNPLIFVKEKQVISGGNFHGEALAMCMDYMAIGLAELANMSERRVEKMMNPTFSDLPAFLAKDSGLNSGFMIAHVTSAALVSENKILCHPASVDSIPTSTDKEDHVSMGVTSGRKLYEIMKNLRSCLAIELLCAAQALDFLRPLKTSPALEKVHALIRRHVAFAEKDRTYHRDIQVLSEIISSNELVQTVEEVTGNLA
ncbi:MAG: histidine ammonia-lyase [Bacteriovoracaceae bacterium]|nr:histidine ammonia-lyase [Bacteriovoracaceae bacterium]